MNALRRAVVPLVRQRCSSGLAVNPYSKLRHITSTSRASYMNGLCVRSLSTLTTPSSSNDEDTKAKNVIDQAHDNITDG